MITATGRGFVADGSSADIVAAYALPEKGSHNGLVSYASSAQCLPGQPQGRGEVRLPESPGKEVLQRMCLNVIVGNWRYSAFAAK